MNQKAIKTLEYNKIIDKLTDLASSAMGKDLCRHLLPFSSLYEIDKSQAETSDALGRILKKGSVSFSGIKDIRPSLMRLEIGASIGIEELLNISSLLNVTLRVKTYSRNENMNTHSAENMESNEKDRKQDSLEERFRILEPLTPLNNEIKRCILSPEEISDDASPGLRHVRRSIKVTNDKVHEQLNMIVTSTSSRTMLQDNLITMRNGRYCIPVKAEYKGQFNGMIHDQSSSGSTLFIEPMAVVKLNNSLRELALKEQEEIDKVLADLSNLAAENIEEMKANLISLSELDFIFAKASLSRQMKGSQPIFNEDGKINIKKGRHPLIDSKKVVPIDVYFGTDFHLLIVTGPNTGGKTVSLKTVGLFTLMGQAGLHIPAFDNSELAVFEEVYADIGDEQSIEQSLSTFSSHMTNIISMIKNATDRSLCLFDELGAGTDPAEGAALAMSILSYLHHKNIRTMATTHYSELKIFALSTKGVENACCEFDVETLRPTYRLLIGIPGKSNAFAISSKLGLPDYIIEDAKKRMDYKDQSFEDVISNLEVSRINIEKEQTEINLYKQEIEALKKKLTIKNEKIDHAKEQILREANEQAHEILQKAKDFADDSIKKYNKWLQDGSAGKDMENERNALRDKLGTAESKLSLKNKQHKKRNNKAGDFKLGDSVYVLSMNLKGIVNSLPNANGDLFVQMGILRSSVHISDLEKIEEETTSNISNNKSSGGSINISKALSIRPEINLIGKMVDEALPLLDKYLDDAYLSHIAQVTIIHGRGTGALKNAVHNHLKKTKYIKSYRLGAFGEGDQGVTIVEFK